MNPESPEVAVRGLDPWGLRRVERLLAALDGVTSVKIVPDGSGGIDEVHVLSGPDLGPKQVVRNIESALLAEFGLQIDHRKISVARVTGPDIATPDEPAPVPEPVPAQAGERFQLDAFQMERKAGQRAIARVTLIDGDKKFTGVADGPDFAKSRLEITGVALLKALEEAMEGRLTLSLEGVSKVDAVGRSMVVAVVYAAAGRKSLSLAGVAKISDSPEEAAIEACLHATNRWIGAK
jgi:hypothetical protein